MSEAAKPPRRREKNYALQAFRKAKKAEKRKKTELQERYDSLCGPVTITYKK
jgi:hypothetical protein